MTSRGACLMDRAYCVSDERATTSLMPMIAETEQREEIGVVQDVLP